MIELKRVSAGYGGEPVLKHIDISFEKGRITSIIGRNGSGKTTLLKVCANQIKHFCGDVFIDGKNIKDFDGRDFAKKVSYLPQVRDIPQTTAEELVLYGRFPHMAFPRRFTDKDLQKAEEAMKSAGVLQLRHKKLSGLSGGERQKVYFAMILAQDADIILLDEPGVYLDINHQLEIMNLTERLKQTGKTIVAVMHDISAALCRSDAICLMDKGEAVICGSPEQVYRSREIDRVFNAACERVDHNGNVFYAFDMKNQERYT
jgi:ABC-type cobalamin/Fe3+-siderophores transport system ATPase subunit